MWSNTRRLIALIALAALAALSAQAQAGSTATPKAPKTPKAQPASTVQPLAAFSESAAPTKKPAFADGVAVVALDDTGGGPEYQALVAMGVPTRVVKEVPQGTGSAVLVLAGTLDAAALPKGHAEQLREYVKSGGILIAEAATDRSLGDLLGFTQLSESRARSGLSFAAGDATLAELDTARERSVQLDDAAQESTVGTVGYTPAAGASALASFDDGSAALLRNVYGSGVAYTVGARLLDLVERHWEGARFSAKRGYANGGDTDADVWLLWLRGVYRAAVPGGVTVSTAPRGSAYAVVPTISANWGGGLLPAYDYVKRLRAIRAASTVFVPTHYTADWLDIGFFSLLTGLAPVIADIAGQQAAAAGNVQVALPTAKDVSGQKLTPVVECVDLLGGGSFRAHFGYTNPNTKVVTIERGKTNALSPSSLTGTQPRQFAPGRSVDHFSVVAGSGVKLVWTLDGKTATAAATSKECARPAPAPTEVAGNSVSHSPSFAGLGLGSGKEAFPSYTPTVVSKTLTKDATLLGELRIPRQLLAPAVTPEVLSFRAPYLLTSRNLAPALDATGYRYDSSTTQGWVQGAFPFHPPRLDGKGFADVVSFPIAVEDEASPRFDQRLEAARQTIAANGANGAPSVILVHPNDVDWKKAAYVDLLAGLPSTTWIGTLRDLGAFWREREALTLVTEDSTVCKGGRHFSVTSPMTTSTQALDVADPALVRAVFADGTGAVVSPQHKLVLPPLAKGQTVSGDICPK